MPWLVSIALADVERLRHSPNGQGLKSRVGDRTLAHYAESLLELAEGGLRRRALKAPDGQDETKYLRPLQELIAAGHTPATRLRQRLAASPLSFTETLRAEARVG